jgi:plasmid rolling circle replication initiator protein Rep
VVEVLDNPSSLAKIGNCSSNKTNRCQKTGDNQAQQTAGEKAQKRTKFWQSLLPSLQEIHHPMVRALLGLKACQRLAREIGRTKA